MKRSYLSLFAVLGVSVSTLGAQAHPMQLGATVDYVEVLWNYEDRGTGVTDHYDTLGGSVFVDLKFARLGLGLSHNFGNQIRFVDGGEEKDDGYRIMEMHGDALGKYPFQFWRGRLAVWPSLGVRYSRSLNYEYQGTRDREINHQPHDLVLLGGCGVDYAVSAPVSLTGVLLGGYTLTPGMGSFARDASGWNLGLSLGAAVAL